MANCQKLLNYLFSLYQLTLPSETGETLFLAPLHHDLSLNFLTFSNLITKMVFQLCLIIMRSIRHISIHFRKNVSTLFQESFCSFLCRCFGHCHFDLQQLFAYLALDDDMNCKIFSCILKLCSWQFYLEYDSLPCRFLFNFVLSFLLRCLSFI